MAGTAIRLAGEDPLNLLVQATRRFLPARLRSLSVPFQGLPGALLAYLQDRPADARRLLDTARPPRHRLARAVNEQLSIELGRDLPADASPRARARAAWHDGDLSDAVVLLAGTRPSRLRDRMESELRLMQPGERLASLPSIPVDRSMTGVVAVLTNARPYTQSGYTMRSQHVFSAVAAGGDPVTAVTRVGYPATIGTLGAAQRWQVGDVSYERLPTPALPAALDARLSLQARKTVPIVDRARPRLLHTTTDWTNAVVTSTVADACDLPWVYEMRGQLELTWIAARPAARQASAARSERVRLLRAKEAELARAADAVVVLSEVQRDDLVERGVPANKVWVVRNAVDDRVLQRQPVAASDAREGLGLPAAGLWVGSVTSVVDYEGLDFLIEAVALGRKQGMDVRCAIVGDGVALPALRAQAERLGLGAHTVFPGRVSPETALRWYEALDIFAVPRRDTPVCRVVTPMKPLEAMALGRPVIASDLPALAEIVGVGGLLCPAESATGLVSALSRLADPQVRARYGEAGRERASRLTWQRAAATYEEMYRIIVEAHG